MWKIVAISALLAVCAYAGPVSCSQVDKYVISNVRGLHGCRCILYNIDLETDSLYRRNIVQYCPVGKGRFLSSIQMKIPGKKWWPYEIMDCAVLDKENVSCSSVNHLKEPDAEPQFISTKLDMYLLFMYETYGKDDIDYLLGN